MKSILAFLLLLLCVSGSHAQAALDIETAYIEQWKQFYPSRALAQGIHTAVFDYEDRSDESIQAWLKFNKTTLKELDPAETYAQEHRIDARLLRMQIRSEIARWEEDAPHRQSLSLYARLIANAVEPVLEADFLTAPERARLICKRLGNVRQLCVATRNNLEKADREDLERSLQSLDRSATFYAEELPEQAKAWRLPDNCQNLAQQCQAAAADIRALIAHATTRLLPEAPAASPVLSREAYANQLRLYTDRPLTPEQLAEAARREIEHVRQRIGEVSRDYLRQQYPARPVPEQYDDIVAAAFADMEKDAPENGAEYLQFWQELSDAAIQFIEEHDIATLPEFQTLRILPAPESAGPAARIGWVDSAPPFAPNPLTTLYLPSIPDTFPERERKEFWASFNKPFNRMIVIHELFPGHYMQIKISRETPHPVRLLFPYGPYFEGWATFCERIVLDAGWDSDRPLTFLAHLRKRLENANRAYTSVQVHCNGWDREQIMKFSTETSLLAPQFAKSLWGRLLRSPIQMTSYFLGGLQFTERYEAERSRLGRAFVLKDFMDTVMRAGPIPIDEFSTIFRQTTSK